MTLEIVLPFGSKSDVKNLVFTLLVKESPLKLIELTNHIRKRYGKEVSFQAVRKAVLQLVDQGILTKDQHFYSINKEWVSKTKSVVDALYLDLHREKTAPQKTESIQGELSVYTFNSLNEMMKFWQDLMQDWVRKFHKGEYSINCYQAAHSWEVLLHLDREQEVMAALRKKGIKSYILFTGNTPLDRNIQRFYRNIGVKVNIAPSQATYDKRHYMGTYGDMIIQSQYPDSLAKELEIFFRANHTIENLDLDALWKIVNKRTPIRLTVIRNLEMAKQLNRFVLSQMGLSN